MRINVEQATQALTKQALKHYRKGVGVVIEAAQHLG
jgi:hypothetical protein